MARTLNRETAAEATKPQPNAASLDGCIKAAFQAIYAKKQDIAAEMAAHVDDHKEDLRKLWQTVKKDTGFNLKDLKLNYALYARERDADDLDDESEREKVQNGLRASFRALKNGQMVNFLDHVETPAGNGADKTSTAKEAKNLAEARTLGRQAGETGKSYTSCTYAQGSDQFKAWQEGWQEMQTEHAKTIGQGQAATA
jgi:ribosome modulation factor